MVSIISNYEVEAVKSMLNERQWQICEYSLPMCMHGK